MKNFLLNLFLNMSKLLDASQNAYNTAKQVTEILNTIVSPCLIALGAMGGIYMVVLGVQYAKSENDNKRADVKKRIVNLAIGVIIIIVLLVLCLAVRWDAVVKELFGYMEDTACISRF